LPTILLCGAPGLEAELEGSAAAAAGIDRHLAARVEDALTLALAARPELVLIDRDLPRAVSLVEGLRSDPSTRRLSIAILARDDFDPGEVAFLEAGANAILRLPPDPSWEGRLQRLMEVAIRKATRLPVSFAVGALPRESSIPVPATALNLSETGMLLESSLELDVGDELGIEFELPEAKEPVVVRGNVVRSGGPRHFGLEFRALSHQARTALVRYLATRAA
jgi:CheY-like chemotaxis protein